MIPRGLKLTFATVATLLVGGVILWRLGVASGRADERLVVARGAIVTATAEVTTAIAQQRAASDSAAASAARSDSIRLAGAAGRARTRSRVDVVDDSTVRVDDGPPATVPPVVVELIHQDDRQLALAEETIAGLRATVASLQAEREFVDRRDSLRVEHITLEESAPAVADGWQCGTLCKTTVTVAAGGVVLLVAKEAIERLIPSSAAVPDRGLKLTLLQLPVP